MTVLKFYVEGEKVKVLDNINRDKVIGEYSSVTKADTYLRFKGYNIKDKVGKVPIFSKKLDKLVFLKYVKN